MLLDREWVETLKKNFPYVAVVVLSYVVYTQNLQLNNIQEARLKDEKADANMYKNGFLETHAVLIKYIQNEKSSSNSDTNNTQFMYGK